MKEPLFYISEHKTGCLISISLWSGARLAKASEKIWINIEFGKRLDYISNSR